jgi:predicted Fe-Mo cluster-binding NifX family protein
MQGAGAEDQAGKESVDCRQRQALSDWPGTESRDSRIGSTEGMFMSRFRNAVATLFLAVGLAGGLTVWAAEPSRAPAPGAQPTATQAPKQLFAIAAEGKELTAKIPFLAARATHYHVYDENGGLVEVLVNPFLKQEEGVGPAAAQMLAERGVTVLVAGMVGPKMKDVLVASKMRFVSRKGDVQGVVNELKKSQ